MKIKHTKLPPNCEYLGHFRQQKHMRAGHNTNAMPADQPKVKTLRESVNAAFPAEQKEKYKSPPPAVGVRG